MRCNSEIMNCEPVVSEHGYAFSNAHDMREIKLRMRIFPSKFSYRTVAFYPYEAFIVFASVRKSIVTG